MNEREKILITIIKLLEEQVACLRSVLSEFEGDKHHFVQMVRADILNAAKETLEFKI